MSTKTAAARGARKKVAAPSSRDLDRGRAEARRIDWVSAQIAVAAHDPETLLRIETVQAMTGLGRSSIYDMERKGRFPSGVRLGTHCVRWRCGDIREFVATAAAK